MSLTDPDALLAVAHIARPHGRHGELSAIVLAPPILDGEQLISGRLLMARDGEGHVRPVKGLAVRPHKGRWLIKLEGVESVADAEALREVDLCLRRADLPSLPQGWYWEADLQGCRVIDARIGEIGRVESLDVNPPQPQLQLRRPDGGQAAIPWVRPLIIGVDIETGEIRTDLPTDFPGLCNDST